MTQERKPDHGLPRKRRITLSRDFARAYREGKRYGSRLMTLWVLPGTSNCGPGPGRTDTSGLRLGVVAGRKVGNAVRRASAKRKIRETWRTNQHLFVGPCDMVVSARKQIGTATADEIRKELLGLAKKAGILE